MSWEEYKKKRNKKDDKVTVTDNTKSKTSSWEEYKQKREKSKIENETTARIKEKIDGLYEEPKQSKIGLKDILTGGSIKLSNGMASQGGKEALESIINPNKVKQEDNRKWFEPGAFKDGYQFGDLSKTVTGTLADVGQDLTKGVAGIGEGLVDTGSYLIDLKSKLEADYIKSMDKSKLSEQQQQDLLKRYMANRQVSQDMRNFIQRDLIEESKIGNVAGNTGVAGTANKLLNNRTDNKIDAFETDSVLGDKSDSLVQSAGQLAGQLGLSYVGVPWWVTSGTTAFAGGTEEAFNNGATEEQAGMYGLINAGAEILSEKISGGISFGGKTLDTGLKDILSKQISNRTVKALTNFGFDATGEGLEEVVTQVLTRLGQKLTYAKEGEWKEILSSPEAMDKWINETINHLTNEEARAEYGESFTGGFVLGGGANTIRLGNSLKNNVDYDTGLPNNTNTLPTAKNQANNNNVLPTAQTIQGQNQVAQNSISEQIKTDSENFAKQIDAVKNGTFPQRDMLVLGKTPQVLKNIGLPDLPITITQKHLDTIMNESGKYTGANYHNLGEEIVKQLPEAINNPLDIVKSNTKDDSIVLTTYLADKQNRPVIASIKIDGKGKVNDIIIDTNVMTSAYGRNNYEKFMEENLKNGNLLYDIDRGVIKKLTEQGYNYLDASVNEITGARLQLSRTSSSNITNSIPPQNKDVNYNNYFMQNAQNNTQNVAPTVENNVLPTAKKKLNPTEISNLTIEDANTTPILPQKNYTKGNKQSSFFRNVIEDAQFLNKDLRQEMSQDENIRYYKGITNAETLEKAYTDLQNGGQNETMRWFNKENKDISAEDIAKGWILLKQYQDSGDYQGAVEVAKKMRNMGTKAGQAVQAYNILSRLTPEGMFYYAQSELSEAYNKMAEGKSKEWIDDNRSKFDLTPEETQIIKEKMESIQGIEDERTKKIALAEIQKIITDKIPPTASQSIKSWMRISMLFNPKTQVRNIAGNAVILPVNMTSDFIASGVDKIISKKTGVRTTGNTNLKNYAKGFGKGLYESYDDFRKGINTRNIEGNRFEVTEGKNFKDKGIGKALNRVDNMLSFMLDAGDRGFYEATFTNSINNQLVLNNTTKVTPDMIDIATQEALQRTWQDNNTYTNAVLKIRKLLNFNKGYGLGDILIPFAKTPANLTKAIVDYSPVGLTKTLAVDARKLNNSLQNGQYTPQLQHKFVQDLGKGMAGTLLYVLGYALAKAGVITGEADEDKDVKNFMKNSLGINSYSIKIGDKSFAYDWAQPVATPFAIMANFEKYNRENPDASVIDKAINSINIGSEQLLQQSFMESINTVLNGNGTALENISQAILELPSRAVPTLSKQVADMIDGTQRTSFEYGKPVESAVNSVVAKIPGLSKTLAPSVDTLGNEIQKYGGDNGVWNVMFNPANMNKGKLSKAGEEIYNVYMETGDATLLPRTAPYYVDSKGEKKTMTSMQRSEFQKITGKYVENTINGLLNNKDYKKLSNDKKSELINEIVSDSYSKAKYDILNIDSEQYEKLRNTLKNVSTTSYYDYKSKTQEAKKDSEKLEVLVNSNYTNKEKQTLYENYIKSKTDEKYDIIKTVNNFNISTYLEYKLASSNGEFSADKKDDGTVSGKTISGSAKNKKFEYISNMKNTPYMQTAILFGLENTPDKSDKATIVNYISSLPGKTNKEKLEMLDEFSWVTVYKNGTIKY